MIKQPFKEALTIYQQIALNVENSILEGHLQPEERLPSLRESAVELEVNINTIMRAYNLLEEEGILTKKRGLGFFVSPDALKRVQEKHRLEFFKETLPTLVSELKRLDISVEELLEILNQSL